MRWCIIVALLLTASIVYAGPWNGGVDQFQITDYYPAGPEQIVPKDVSFKTLGTQTINTSVQNCILIPAGQSNNVNTAPSNFLPVNASSIDNLNINDGAIYKAADPLIGTSYAPIGQSPQPTAAGFGATQSTTVLTVGSVSYGTLGVGQTVTIPGFTTELITSLGTGSGGAGTYNVSVSQSIVSSTSMTATPNGGHPALRTADALVTAGKCARVIIEPISISATLIAAWDVGGLLQTRISVALRRIAQRLYQTGPSVTCGSTNVTCVIDWGQGENDNNLCTTQAAYTNSLNSMIATSNSVAASLGWPTNWGRWLVAKESYFTPCGGGAGAVSATIQAAQAAVINNTQVFMGVNADAFVGSVCGVSNNQACRDASTGFHWTDAGSLSRAVDPTNGLQQALHASGSPF